jgi:ribosomal protein S18 acetylase RimI-like enzyme
MMAHTPARYGPLLESLGLRKVHDFHAFVLDKAGVMARQDSWSKLRVLTGRILARDPELRIMRATKQDLAATLHDVNTFGNRIRETVWGFTPITAAELDFLTRRIMRVMIPELILTMRRRDELVGYVMAVPDVNQALARARGGPDIVRLAQMPFLMPKIRRARMFGIGTDPRFRSIGILPALFQAMVEGTIDRFDEFEFGWISEANLQSLRAVQHILPMEPKKTYRLYEAPLPFA